MSDENVDLFTVAGKGGAARVASPPFAHHGTWGKAESLVFSQHLKLGALSDALELLGGLDDEGARAVLLEAGFKPQLVGTRMAMLKSVQFDLVHSAQQKDAALNMRSADDEKSAGKPERRTFPGTDTAPSFMNALKAIQAVLSAPDVEVGLAGAASLDSRASLQFVAAQAIERGVSGFAVDGVTGKFRLPDSADLPSLKDLYSVSGGALAEAEVRAIVPGWASGKTPQRLPSVVPEGVARVLRGSPTLQGVELIRSELAAGSVRDYGAQQGVQQATHALTAQGVRLDAPNAERLIEQAGLKLTAPDRQRGQYVGPVVAVDHRASVVKWSRDSAIVISHRELPEGGARPEKGDTLRVKFSGGQAAVMVQPKNSDRSVGR
jgi:hypothetical protein